MANAAERDLAEIRRVLGTRQTDSWGREAMRAADALSAQVARAVDAQEVSALRVGNQLAALGVVIEARLSELVQEAKRANGLLQDISTALSRPRATAAEELYQRGVRAYENSWWAEAAEWFESCVESDPDRADSRLALAMVMLQVGDTNGAALNFGFASRYALPYSPTIAAFATSWQARVLAAAARPGDAVSALDGFLRVRDECAELHLQHAQLSRDHAHVNRALWLAPEHAASAVAFGLPGALEAVANLTTLSDGPLSTARQVADLVARFDSVTYGALQLGKTATLLSRRVASREQPEAMAWAGAVHLRLRDSIPYLERMAEWAISEDRARSHRNARMRQLKSDATDESARIRHQSPGRIVVALLLIGVATGSVVAISFFWGNVPVGLAFGLTSAVFCLAAFALVRSTVRGWLASRRIAALAVPTSDRACSPAEVATRERVLSSLRRIAEERKARLFLPGGTAPLA